jgi:hypothetical protein
MAERPIQAATTSSDSDNSRQPGQPAAAIRAGDPGGIGIVRFPIRATQRQDAGDIPTSTDDPADAIDIDRGGSVCSIPCGGRRISDPSPEDHPSPIIRAIKDGHFDRPPAATKIGMAPIARIDGGRIIEGRPGMIRERDGAQARRIGISCGDEQAGRIAR